MHKLVDLERNKSSSDSEFSLLLAHNALQPSLWVQYQYIFDSAHLLAPLHPHRGWSVLSDERASLIVRNGFVYAFLDLMFFPLRAKVPLYYHRQSFFKP